MRYIQKSLAEVFGIDSQVKISVRDAENDPAVPRLDPAYAFDEEKVRGLLLWLNGAASGNLMISGPTGCGKSSLVEQCCARIGRKVYRFTCHNRMEFSDLTGQLVIRENGSTEFIHGALPRAMLEGAVLLLDEVNFIPAGAIGALNTVLDGGMLRLSETGELVVPHPDFRIAATGNAIDGGEDASLYKGTQRMNLAFIQRFLVMRTDYMEKSRELMMLEKTFPAVPRVVLMHLVHFANDVREAFKKGDMESTVSTRVLTRLASIISTRVEKLHHNPVGEISYALKLGLTDGMDVDEAAATQKVLIQRIDGLVLPLCQNDKEPPDHDDTPLYGKEVRANVAVNVESLDEGDFSVVASFTKSDDADIKVGKIITLVFKKYRKKGERSEIRPFAAVAECMVDAVDKYGYQHTSDPRELNYDSSTIFAQGVAIALRDAMENGNNPRLKDKKFVADEKVAKEIVAAATDIFLKIKSAHAVPAPAP